MSSPTKDSEMAVQELYVPTSSVLGEHLYQSPSEVFRINTTTMPYSVSALQFCEPLTMVQLIHAHTGQSVGGTSSIGAEENYICRFNYCLYSHTFTRSIQPETNAASSEIFGYPRVLDLFCGAGGFSAAAELNSFEVVAGVDSDANAITAFRDNHPEARAFHERVEMFLDSGKKHELGRIGVIIAGPPCPGFSMANPYAAQDFQGRALLLQICRAIHIYTPKVVIVENVTGILQKTGSPYFYALLTDLLEAGYEVSWTVLSAPVFGSCQNRSRVFVVGTKGVSLPPQPTKHYSRNSAQAVGAVLDCIPVDAANHRPFEITKLTLSSQSTCVLDRYRLCDTVRASPSDRWTCYLRHHDSYRLLSPREVACIQGMSLNFTLDGDWRAAFRQAANAVPLELGDAVMDAVAESFEGIGIGRRRFGVPLLARSSDSPVEYENELEEGYLEGPVSSRPTSVPCVSEVISYEEEWISVVDSTLRIRPKPATNPCVAMEESSDSQKRPSPKVTREAYATAQGRYLDGFYKSTTKKHERMLICSCCHELRNILDLGSRPYSRKYPICNACRDFYESGRFEDIADEWIHPLPASDVSDEDLDGLLDFDELE